MSQAESHDSHPRSEGSWAGLALLVALAILPITGASYRVQYRLTHEA
jgi:hypothetical protein